MKRLLLYCFVLFAGLYASAKSISFEALLGSHKNLLLEDILLSDLSTKVVLSYSGTPYSWINLSPSIYACDEECNRHKVIRTEGIKLGERLWLGDDGKVSFALYFDPLPKGTKLFDIIEGNLHGGFYLYGIHRSSAKLNIPRAVGVVDQNELVSSVLKPDSAFIRGRFNGYERRSIPALWEGGYESKRVNPFDMEQSPTILKIEPDGSFCCGFLVDSSTWTYIDNWSGRSISFYIRPGDTLDIQIDHFGQWNEVISYKNLSGKPCYGNLMNCNKEAVWERLQDLRNESSIKQYDDKLYSLSEEVEKLIDYFSWKYHLSGWETHLLMSDWKLTHLCEKAEIRESKAFSLTVEQQKQLESSKDSTQIKVLKDYSFLNNDIWQDASIRITQIYERCAEIAKRNGILISELGDDNIVAKGNPTALQFSTYRIKDAKTQTLIDSIIACTASKYLEVAFMKPTYDKITSCYLSSLRHLTADFSKSDDIAFVAVIDEDLGNEELSDFTRSLSYYCPHIITLTHEDFLSVQTSFRQISAPFNITLTKDGEVFRWPLFLTQETSFRDSFRELLKRDKKNATNRN